MAARRVAASSVDWAAFAARVPEGQRPMFNAFKAKSDGYLRHVLSRPEALPKIDFAVYKARVAVPGMVEQFQKLYEATDVPYPADTVSPQIDAAQKQAAEDCVKFVQESEGRITQLQKELVQWQAMIPFDQMTMEEFVDAFPDKAINLDSPTLWPHGPEDQPGYVAKEGAEEAA